MCLLLWWSMAKSLSSSPKLVRWSKSSALQQVYFPFCPTFFDCSASGPGSSSPKPWITSFYNYDKFSEVLGALNFFSHSCSAATRPSERKFTSICSQFISSFNLINSQVYITILYTLTDSFRQVLHPTLQLQSRNDHLGLQLLTVLELQSTEPWKN